MGRKHSLERKQIRQNVPQTCLRRNALLSSIQQGTDGCECVCVWGSYSTSPPPPPCINRRTQASGFWSWSYKGGKNDRQGATPPGERISAPTRERSSQNGGQAAGDYAQLTDEASPLLLTVLASQCHASNGSEKHNPIQMPNRFPLNTPRLEITNIRRLYSQGADPNAEQIPIEYTSF